MTQTTQKIPEGWKVTKLNDFANIIMGQSPSSKDYNQKGDGLPFFQGKTDFDSKNNRPLIRQWTSRSTKIASENSILFTVRAPVGDVIMNNIEACIGRGLASIEAKNGGSNQFLFFYLQHIGDQFEKYAQGSTFTAINSTELKNYEINVPPIKEQTKIATILSKVDSEIEKVERIIEQTEKLKKGLMQKLLTKGIGHKKFKKTELGEIPEEWELVTLKESDIEIIDGDRGENYPKKNEFMDEGYCLFLSNKNIKNDKFVFNECAFITEEKDNLLRKGKLKRFDIILTTRGTVGNVAFFDKNVPFENIRLNSGMLIFRAGNCFASEFLYALFKSHLMKTKYKSVTSGSAQPQLPIRSLEQIKIPLPPKDEQKKIAQILESADQLLHKTKKQKK